MVWRSRQFRLWSITLGSSLLVLTTVAGLVSDRVTLPAALAGTVAPPAQVANAERLKPLYGADIVYLGETHTSPADHAAQLEILQALYAKNPQLAIGMEMFQRPFQAVLDEYLAGTITEAELVQRSDYDRRWGFPWEYYAPILRFAKAKQLPVIALNAPAEVTRKVAREGLDGLTAADFRDIPDRAQLDTSNANYRRFVLSAFDSHAAHGNFNVDHFFAAQVVWDETMAQSIATFRRANPRTQVVVLAGQGHVVYGYGIPDRVARRLGRSLNQKIVLLNPPPDLNAAAETAIADLLWYSASPLDAGAAPQNTGD